LFFDLIFVAAMFRLGGLLFKNYQAADTQSEMFVIVGECFIVFSVLWLTWNHLNLILTRFELRSPWSAAQLATYVLSIALAISMSEMPTGSDHDNTLVAAGARDDDDGHGRIRREVSSVNARPAFKNSTFHIVWMLSRLVFLVVYMLGVGYIKTARKFCTVYAAHYTVSCMLTCGVAVAAWRAGGINDIAAIVISVIAIVVECFMHVSLSLLSISSSFLCLGEDVFASYTCLV
jgi:hypothetical protein